MVVKLQRNISSAGVPSSVLNAWLEIVAGSESLASPFFSPAYVSAIARSGRCVDVAWVEEGGCIEAIFPFERRRLCLAQPVGTILTDYSGVISASSVSIDFEEIKRVCGLLAIDFRFVPAEQAVFRPFWFGARPSYQLDLRLGYDAYLAEQERTGSQFLKRNAAAKARLAREHGDVTFRSQIVDACSLERLFRWKSAQYRRTGVPDVLARPWVRRALEMLHGSDAPTCTGVLSELHSGERCVAAHFGLRSQTVLHYWFPAYDPNYAKHSPGAVLLIELAKWAASEGIKTVDLGCGEYEYKRKMMNAEAVTAYGSIQPKGLGKVRSVLNGPLTFARKLRPDTVGVRTWRQLTRSAKSIRKLL